jgi:hypothetical protein
VAARIRRLVDCSASIESFTFKRSNVTLAGDTPIQPMLSPNAAVCRLGGGDG